MGSTHRRIQMMKGKPVMFRRRQTMEQRIQEMKRERLEREAAAKAAEEKAEAEGLDVKEAKAEAVEELDREKAFARLKELGVNPHPNTGLAKLRDLLELHTQKAAGS